jgi:two-component system cell cycle sensor histidine kinase/response regulator CckA
MLYRLGVNALKHEVRQSLIQMAETAAAFVDGDLHQTFTSPEQEDTPAYRQAVEPLRRVLHAHSDIRFLYTMILHQQQACFILDATPPGDADKDGVEDHSPIMQPFDTPAPALMDALTNGRPQADAKPINDRWGTYLSGYAPIRDSRGRQVGIAGVDLKLGDYDERLAGMGRALGFGVTVACLLALLIGIGTGGWMSRAQRSEHNRRIAAAALIQSETQYRMLFEQMVSGFATHEMIYDEQGNPIDYKFLAVNAAFEHLTGLRAADLIGKTVKTVLPTTEPSWVETFGQVVTSGTPVQFENYHQGLGRHYQVTAYRPAPHQFACIFTDITHQKHMEEERLQAREQLQHTQKLEGLGLMASGIAHDFNNLLMAILGNADLALADTPEQSPLRPSLSQIKDISLQAADLCRQMLAYSGKGKFLIEPVNLSRLAGAMVRLIEVAISKMAVLRCSLSEDLPAVEADVTQLRQVIMNLVINASEAIGEEGGVISLSTGTMTCDEEYLRGTYVREQGPPGAYVYLEVADTGCGMDKETQSRLFDPFFTTKLSGRGLGLTAVVGIVRGHHGVIKVDSEPGKGTVFRVLFPASGAPAPVAGPRPPSPEWKGQGAILLVDDEANVLSVTKRMLEYAGFTVITAANGLEAVAQFRQHGDDLRCVLMDLTMPHMDGETAFREMRKIRTDIPVILASGYSAQAIGQRFAGTGLAGFIEKPYQLATLVDTLRKACESRAG